MPPSTISAAIVIYLDNSNHVNTDESPSLHLILSSPLGIRMCCSRRDRMGVLTVSVTLLQTFNTFSDDVSDLFVPSSGSYMVLSLKPSMFNKSC